MKKLAIVFASLALAATPVFACPHSDSEDQATPKTAEKAKDAPKADTKAKAAPKKEADTAKQADKAKPAAPKKPAEKVSSK
ncbi:MAG: hypothetical protein ABI867_38485 [Kofleriaceae bacterium]